LSLDILIVDGDSRRSLADADLPISIGGPNADVRIADGEATVLAHIGEDQGELFIQPAAGVGSVRCNGDALTTSRWLRDGDQVSIGADRFTLAIEADEVRVDVIRGAATGDKPVLTPPPRPDSGSSPSSPVSSASESAEPTEVEGVLIAPAEFTPYSAQSSRRRSNAARTAFALTWLILILLAVAAWFTFTARTVELQIEPQPESVEIQGALLQFEIGGRYLLRPGSYSVIAFKEGFRKLEAAFEVTDEPNQVHTLQLEQLPGLLVVRTEPAEGVLVTVDGTTIGTTPLDPIELQAGEHRVEASAERYRAADTIITTEGSGSRTETELTLSPLWAAVSFDSSPQRAQVRVDGEALGRTPVTVDLLEGRRQVELRLDGHKPYRTTLRVAAGQPLSPAVPTLQPVDGWLTLTTEPAGAAVTIGGEYRGVTPLDLELTPGREYEISASLRAHGTATESLQVVSGTTHELHLVLEAETGQVEIVTSPADAEVFVDGTSQGTGSRTLELTAEPHQIEVRKPGYLSSQHEATPRPGFPQSLEVELETEAEVKAAAVEAARKPVIQTSQGQEMRRIEPGRFRMGASRREPGRRSNETLREVELTRAFYLATEEVSNSEYRQFRDAHRAGAVGNSSLDLDDHPVVKVTWEDAARYCNWLSRQESLTPFYDESSGVPEAKNRQADGYRLPTEAEWAWAARYEGGGTPRKYPWGDSLPVANGSGNYADSSARGILPSAISGYSDSHAATAPVDSFPPNALGLLNIGGNVAEWTHDVYSIYSSASTGIDRDPAGPAEGQYHVIRGAGWMDATISELRLTYRDYGDKARPDVGFRIARNAN
jgi:formylglycine-generating enzyme required for sulfatase activity